MLYARVLNLVDVPDLRRDVFDFVALLDDLPQLDTVLLQRVRIDGFDYDTTFAGYNHDVVRGLSCSELEITSPSH